MRLKSKQPLGFAQRPQRRPFSRNQVSRRNGLRRTLDFIRLTLRHSSALRHVASVPTTPAGCCLLVLVATVPQPLPLLPSCSLTLWTKAAPQRYLPLRPLAFGLWPTYFSPSMRRLPKALSGPPPVLSSPPLILVSFLSALGPLTDAAATHRCSSHVFAEDVQMCPLARSLSGTQNRQSNCPFCPSMRTTR